MCNDCDKKRFCEESRNLYYEVIIRRMLRIFGLISIGYIASIIYILR